MNDLKIESCSEINRFENDLKKQLAECRCEKFLKGEIIVRQNSYIKVLPVLLSGQIRVSRQTEDKELLLYYVNREETCMVSLVACLEDRPLGNIELVAVKDSEVMMIPRDKVYEWKRLFPTWNEYIFRTFSRSQLRLLESLDSLAFSRVDERIKNYLSAVSSRERRNIIEITHQELANELGTSRVVISRILKELELKGAIELLRGSIIIKNLKLA
jgi:CRP/FNR family transcriptional regulator, anaerobic regulatory protein